MRRLRGRGPLTGPCIGSIPLTLKTSAVLAMLMPDRAWERKMGQQSGEEDRLF